MRRGQPFEQMKVLGKKTQRAEKTLKKGILHNHLENSSVPQDQKVTKSPPSTLGKHISSTENLKKLIFEKFFLFFYLGKSHSAKKIKVAINASKTLLFLLKIERGSSGLGKFFEKVS